MLRPYQMPARNYRKLRKCEPVLALFDIESAKIRSVMLPSAFLRFHVFDHEYCLAGSRTELQLARGCSAHRYERSGG